MNHNYKKNTLLTYKKEKRIEKSFAFLLSLHFSIMGTLSIYTLKDSALNLVVNPYDGNTIDISDNLQEILIIKSVKELNEDEMKISELIKHVKNNLGEDEKKNYLILSALALNDSFSKEEKKELLNIINYINDDPYINYEYIFEKILCVDVYRNQQMSQGVAANYTRDFNLIRLGTNNEEALTHEFFHTISNYNIGIQKNSWFEEGMSSILDYEYFEKEISYPLSTNFIRILCEFVGPDVLLRTKNEGNINILIDELVSKGLEKHKILHLFETLDKYNNINFNYDIDEDEKKLIKRELKATIIEYVWEFYNSIDNNKNANPLIYQYISSIFDESDGIGNIYYFNSIKKLKQPALIEEIYYYDHYDYDMETLKPKPPILTKKIYHTNTCVELYFIEGNEEKLIHKKYYTKEEIHSFITEYLDLLKLKNYSK